MRRAVLVIALALVVQGCATPRQPYGLTTGCYGAQLDSKDFTLRVTFRGDPLIQVDQVADFASLCSAKLALEHRFKYFVVTDQKTEIIDHGQRVTQPVTSNTIQRYEEKRHSDQLSYNAESVCKKISDKYSTQLVQWGNQKSSNKKGEACQQHQAQQTQDVSTSTTSDCDLPHRVLEWWHCPQSKGTANGVAADPETVSGVPPMAGGARLEP